MKFLNRVRVATDTTGDGTITLGSAITDGFLDAEEAGAETGDVIRYVIEEGSDFEIGFGTYDATGGTLTRTVEASKIGGVAGTAKMSLSGNAQVRFIASADDYGGFSTTAFLEGVGLIGSNLPAPPGDDLDNVTFNSRHVALTSANRPGETGAWVVDTFARVDGTRINQIAYETTGGGAWGDIQKRGFGSGGWSAWGPLGADYLALDDLSNVDPETGRDALGLGDAVLGPESSTNNNLPQWDGTTGKLLKDGRAIGVGSGGAIPDRDAADGRYDRAIDRSISVVTLTNTTDETSIYSFTVPANTLTPGRMLRLQIHIHYTKNAAGSLTVRGKFGATTYGTIAVADGDLSNSATVRGLTVETTLIGTASAAQSGLLFGAVGGNVARVGNPTEPAENSAADIVLEVTAQFSAASANLIISKIAAILEIV